MPLALGAAPAGAASTPAPLQPWLARQLTTVSASLSQSVLVHGTDVATARAAVASSGLHLVTTFDRIGVAVARGTTSQITAVRSRPGVTYVEGDQPIAFSLDHSHQATRGAEAAQTLSDANGGALDGSGVACGDRLRVDPTHPFLQEPGGGTAVVRSLKSVCLDESTQSTSCILDVPTAVDADTLSGGGHGTHVNGIVAGRPTTTSDGRRLQGAAPGAKLVDISTGAVLLIVGADSALNWVLENHDHPCGASVPASTCPPIKVTQQLLRTDRRRRVRPELGDREAAARAGGRGRGDGVGRGQRRR